jgi:hypothetical protein
VTRNPPCVRDHRVATKEGHLTRRVSRWRLGPPLRRRIHVGRGAVAYLSRHRERDVTSGSSERRRSRGTARPGCESKRRLEEELFSECAANRAYAAYRARGVDKTGRRFGKPPTP